MKLKGGWTYIFYHQRKAFSVVTAPIKICEVHGGIQSELLSSKNWKYVSRMQERTAVWGSLFGAACPIPEGHNKVEGEKNQPCVTLQNRVENILLCVYTVKSKTDM